MKAIWAGIILVALAMSGPLLAAPVARDEAFKAASTELPRFYAGNWSPAGEILLYDLAGDVAAYLFMFDQTPKRSQTASDDFPAAFVENARAELAAAGKTVSGYEFELRGENRYASIVISADDAEPPVLRCFQGLPAQLVREANARELARQTQGGGAWRVRHCLMLGFFDEAFALEPVSGAGEALVVDLRSRAVVTEREAKARARLRKAAAPDPERVRLCQEAWQPYRTTILSTAVPLALATPAAGGAGKTAAVPSVSSGTKGGTP